MGYSNSNVKNYGYHIRLITGLIVILLICQMSIPHSTIVTESTGLTTWTQNTKSEFEGGTFSQLEVNQYGEISLAEETLGVADEFNDETRIESYNNVFVDTVNGEVGLQLSAPKNVSFNKTFGGTDDEIGYCVQQTSDGGFIIVGHTASKGAGDWDLILIKTDSSGNQLWERVYGNIKMDYGNYVHQTSDGGYIITGATVPPSSDRSEVWLVKTDSAGMMTWNKTYPAQYSEYGACVRETADGGFIIAGKAGSIRPDVWIIKTDISGNKQWDKKFDTGDEDYGHFIQQTSDGGYIIVGRTMDTTNDENVYLIKIDGNGNGKWTRVIGGAGREAGYEVYETRDSGFIIFGASNTDSHGLWDAMILKTNSMGYEQWTKLYGGPGVDTAYSGRETYDGGFIMFATTDSNSAMSFDAWLIKTDSNGNHIWNKTYGSSNREVIYGGELTVDGGYVLCGLTESYGAGGEDIWLLKVECRDYPYFGDMSSSDLIPTNFLSLDKFDYEAVIPASTLISIQFSTDGYVWYNSKRQPDVWSVIADGINSFDLSSFSSAGNAFYYKIRLISENSNIPVLKSVSLSYSKITDQGNYESVQFNSNNDFAVKTIKWTADLSSGMSIGFQLRTEMTKSALNSKEYAGPDGKSNSYYTVSGSPAWQGHDLCRWMQYRVVLSKNNDVPSSPVLYEVKIDYNILPSKPDRLVPADDSVLNGDKLSFGWEFGDIDSDGQGAFQWQADDEIDFSGIEYDSGIIEDNTPRYEPDFELDDGIWYWRLRTRDSDGNWGPYNSSVFLYDSKIEAPLDVKITPADWTSVNKYSVTWTDPEDLSGIENGVYYLQGYSPPKYANDGTWKPGKPFTFFAEYEGESTLYLWLKDKAGNSDFNKYATIPIKLDTIAPDIIHSPKSWINENEKITINAQVTDESSGVSEVILYYKYASNLEYNTIKMVSTDSEGKYYTVDLPANFTIKENIQYFIKATDLATPANTHFFGKSGVTTVEPLITNYIELMLFPKVKSTQPTGDNVSVKSLIKIEFNKEMNKKLTEAAFSIAPITLGDWSWDKNTLIFTPTTQLKYQTNYSIRLKDSAECKNGCNIDEDYTWSFTTEKKSGGGGPYTGPGTTGSGEDDKEGGLDTNTIILIIVVIIVLVMLIIIGIVLKRKSMESEQIEKPEDGIDEASDGFTQYDEKDLYKDDTVVEVIPPKAVAQEGPMYEDISTTSGEYLVTDTPGAPPPPFRSQTPVSTYPGFPQAPPPMQTGHRPPVPPPPQATQVQYPFKCNRCGSPINQPNWCPRCGTQ